MPKSTNTQNNFYFEGFEPSNTTPVPDVLFDRLLARLKEAELKALLYIIRRTYGFKKSADAVSFNQFLRGITTKDGKILDEGCGIRDRTTLSKALKSLEAMGIIKSEKGVDERGENTTTVYSVRWQGGEDAQGVVGISYHRGMNPPLPVVGKSYSQETEIQETVKQDIYPSKIRNAKSGGESYVKFDGHTDKAAEHPSLTHNEGVGHSQYHSTTNDQNIEKIKAHKNFARAQQNDHAPAADDSQRKGGLAHISQTVQSRLPIAPPTVDATVARDAIERFIRDTAAKLHDEAPLKSSTTRAFNLYQRSGVDMGTFYNLMYDAEKEANRRSATIKKLTAQGFKNRMAYFFALLEDKLGLREKPLPNGS